MIRILFCNISYLPYYNTRLDRVAPKNGGAYIKKVLLNNLRIDEIIITLMIV